MGRQVKLLSRVRLFATPWTVAYQAPPSNGFSRQEYWTGLPFPSPGDLPNPGIKPGSPTLEADALTSEPPGKPQGRQEGQVNTCPSLSLILQPLLFPTGENSFRNQIGLLLLLNQDSYHWLPWFSGLLAQTELHHQLSWVSSLQMADCGISQPP